MLYLSRDCDWPIIVWGATPLLVLQMQWHLSRSYYARKSFPQTWEAYELALHHGIASVASHASGMRAGASVLVTLRRLRDMIFVLCAAWTS